MKKFKKVLSGLLMVSVIASMGVFASAATIDEDGQTQFIAAMTDEDTGLYNAANDNVGDTLLNGSAIATIVSFTVPVETTFAINPNESVYADRFSAPTFTVTNTSTAPLQVGIKDFSYKGGLLNETSVADAYTDEQWQNMGVVNSVKKFALKVKATNPSQWATVSGSSTWAKDDFSSSGIYDFGSLLSGQSATFGFEAKHGSSFPTAITSTYKITFIFGLVQSAY